MNLQGTEFASNGGGICKGICKECDFIIHAQHPVPVWDPSATALETLSQQPTDGDSDANSDDPSDNE